jgi:hypothetical protein
MSTTSTSCPSCGSGNKDTHPERTATQRVDREATQRVAAAIVRGSDLGGIFKLANTLAKARCDVGIGADANGTAALLAAIQVQASFYYVRREFEQLQGKEEYCTRCKLLELLEYLIEFAVATVGRQGPPATLAACEYLAAYAGDDETDPDATRAALERARDVFVAAISAK